MTTLTEALLEAIEEFKTSAPSNESYSRVDAYTDGWVDGAVVVLKRLQEKNEKQG